MQPERGKRMGLANQAYQTRWADLACQRSDLIYVGKGRKRANAASSPAMPSGCCNGRQSRSTAMSIAERERCCVEGCRDEPKGWCSRCHRLVCMRHINAVPGPGGKMEAFLCPECYKKQGQSSGH